MLHRIRSIAAVGLLLAACSPPPAFAQTPSTCVRAGSRVTIQAASHDTTCLLKSGAVSYTVTIAAVSPAPAPTPAPIDPPVSLGEPAFDATKQTMILQDDIEGYSDVVSMGATSTWNTYPRIVPNPSPVTTSQPVQASSNQLISPGHGGTGKAIRMLYDGSYQGSSKFETINLPDIPDLATHYMQYYGRVTFAQPLTGPLAVKWFLGWHKYSSTRVEWNTRYPSTAYRPGDTNPTIWQVIDQADAPTNGDQPVGPYPLKVFDGQWHRFTYSYRPNTSKGARDGFARMWVDGVKVIDVSAAACGTTPPGGTHAWCTLADVDNLDAGDGIRQIDWGWTQTTETPAWTYDVDDVKWWIDK